MGHQYCVKSRGLKDKLALSKSTECITSTGLKWNTLMTSLKFETHRQVLNKWNHGRDVCPCYHRKACCHHGGATCGHGEIFLVGPILKPSLDLKHNKSKPQSMWDQHQDSWRSYTFLMSKQDINPSHYTIFLKWQLTYWGCNGLMAWCHVVNHNIQKAAMGHCH